MSSNSSLKRIKLPHGVSALIYHNNEILACKRRTSELWGYPGGKIHEGESPLTALLREIKEETGLSLTEDQCELLYEGECATDTVGDKPYWVYAFKFTISKRQDLAPMPGEPECKWLSIEEFLNTSAFPEFNQLTINKLLNS